MDIQCGCVYLDGVVACKNVKIEEKQEIINEVDQEGNEQDPQQDPQQERENPEGNVVEELDVLK